MGGDFLGKEGDVRVFFGKDNVRVLLGKGIDIRVFLGRGFMLKLI